MPVLRPRRGGKRRDESKDNSADDSKEQTEAVSKSKKAHQQDKPLTFAEDASDLKTLTSQEKPARLGRAKKEVIVLKPKLESAETRSEVPEVVEAKRKQIKTVSFALDYGDEKEVKETRTRGRQRRNVETTETKQETAEFLQKVVIRKTRSRSRK